MPPTGGHGPVACPDEGGAPKFVASSSMLPSWRQPAAKKRGPTRTVGAEGGSEGFPARGPPARAPAGWSAQLRAVVSSRGPRPAPGPRGLSPCPEGWSVRGRAWLQGALQGGAGPTPRGQSLGPHSCPRCPRSLPSPGPSSHARTRRLPGTHGLPA